MKTQKEINAAKRAANKSILNAEATLSNRCKRLYEYRNDTAVNAYIKALGLTMAEVKDINPAEIVKLWPVQTDNGAALIAKSHYKQTDKGEFVIGDNGKKVLDFQTFEAKTTWSFKNVLDLLDWSKRKEDKRPQVRIRKVGIEYDVTNGVYAERKPTETPKMEEKAN